MSATLRLGTRGSALALQQAGWVKDKLESADQGLRVTLVTIKTTGDKILDVPLARVGGKGLFVKEIEEALLSGAVDLAVHSMKDVPTDLPLGLGILAVPAREDPRDVLISREAHTLQSLPAAARVGTSSLRRLCQIRHVRPDLEALPLRGNLDTRLRKLREGHYEAIVVAAAGLARMGRAGEVTEYLEHEVSLPAIGQGALGIEGLEADGALKARLMVLHDPETALCVEAERAFLRTLEGGCQVPIAAHARLQGDEIVLEGLVGSEDGRTVLRDRATASSQGARAVGESLARSLLRQGADRLLAEVYGGRTGG